MTTQQAEQDTPLVYSDDYLAIGNADELAVRIRRLTEYALRPGIHGAALARETAEVRDLLARLTEYVDEATL